MSNKDLRYPIGVYNAPKSILSTHITTWISTIENFPDTIDQLTKHLTPKQLAWVYRPQGWSIKQVVHHCADSHINSIIRFKLALTEDKPTIKPYNEAAWATLVDCNDDNLSNTMQLLKGLHNKWVMLLKHLSPKDLERTYKHPDYKDHLSIAYTIGMYAWHCKHHAAHIEQALLYKGSFN